MIANRHYRLQALQDCDSMIDGIQEWHQKYVTHNIILFIWVRRHTGMEENNNNNKKIK